MNSKQALQYNLFKHKFQEKFNLIDKKQMKILHLHKWDVDIATAKKIQLDFQEKIILQHLQQPIHFIAGADVSYSRKLNKSFSAVTVFK